MYADNFITLATDFASDNHTRAFENNYYKSYIARICYTILCRLARVRRFGSCLSMNIAYGPTCDAYI